MHTSGLRHRFCTQTQLSVDITTRNKSPHAMSNTSWRYAVVISPHFASVNTVAHVFLSLCRFVVDIKGTHKSSPNKLTYRRRGPWPDPAILCSAVEQVDHGLPPAASLPLPPCPTLLPYCRRADTHSRRAGLGGAHTAQSQGSCCVRPPLWRRRGHLDAGMHLAIDLLQVKNTHDMAWLTHPCPAHPSPPTDPAPVLPQEAGSCRYLPCPRQ